MPRITAQRMAGNHTIDGAWCPGCGLYNHVHGQHRGDCNRGHHGHLYNEPCTPRCTGS